MGNELAAGGPPSSPALWAGNEISNKRLTACLPPDTGARNIDSLLNQQILPVLPSSCWRSRPCILSLPDCGLTGMMKTELCWNLMRNNGGSCDVQFFDHAHKLKKLAACKVGGC